MELQQLKKKLKKQLQRELKQQKIKTKKSSSKRWVFYVLAVLMLTASLFPVYRKQQLTASQQLFAKGVKLESLGQIVAAEESYRQLYQHYPQAEEAAGALLKIARLQQYDHQDEQLALLNYLQLEHDYPESPLVLPAREEAVQIVKYTLRDYSRAIELYQRLLDLNRGNPAQYYYEISDCYFRLENYSQARIELETLLEKYPHSPLAAKVLYRKGGILLLEGRGDEARQDWQSLIAQYPDSRYQVQARFDLAKLQEEEGSLEAALESYQQLEGFSHPALLQKKVDHLKQRIKAKKGAM